MNRVDLEAMLDIVRQHLRGPAPNLSAYRIAHELETALSARTAANGSTETPPRDTELDEWVNTSEAAKLLNTSERWARDLAPRIGGIKQAGRWLIPKDSLPQEDQ